MPLVHVFAGSRKLYGQDGINCNEPKYSDRQVWANSVDPDATAPDTAILSASFEHITVWLNHTVQILEYRKTPKFSDTQEIAVSILKYE